LCRDGRDGGLRLVDASGGGQARTQQTTRSQQRLWAVRRRGSVDPLLRPPAGKRLFSGSSAAISSRMAEASSNWTVISSIASTGWRRSFISYSVR
jgi:hypothetical protein